MEPTGKKEGMRKYCCKCPCFRLLFGFHTYKRSYTCEGRAYKRKYACVSLEGRCLNKNEVYCSPEKPMWFYDIEINDEVKSKLFLGEIKFRYNEIPSVLSEITERYIGKKDCVIPIKDKDCTFHVERNLEEWNKE